MASHPRSSDEIREAFLGFFQERGHQLIPGWPLVPVGDPTTLFTAAGMQQFKPYFTGDAQPEKPRATTVQRCFRTSDIEEVGDHSHLTAFEMLGNFSFGDYFKRDAIAWAWELLTAVYGIEPERLHITIYLTDEEAHGHWRAIGVPDERIHRYDESENYWFSGPVGLCGPNSEIYYDFEPDRGTAGADPPNQDRFLEIWNLVFMQNFRHEDGSLSDLPAKNIDTGSGLERVAAVLQGKRSVFETDIFLPILEEAAGVLGVDYLGGGAGDEQAYVVRAMAEHCRAAALLVGDGVVPSNEGRGYILRRIIRRAIFLARREGAGEPFFTRIASVAVDKLAGAYPHLAENRDFIMRALAGEEDRFLRTLAAASQRLDAALDRLRAAGRSELPGAEAFELYDTFGLPIELTTEIAERAGFTVDAAGFEAALEAQRTRARQSAKFFQGEALPALRALGEEHSAFVGYDHVDYDAQIVGMLRDGAAVEAARAGEQCEIVLDATPFYPEGGGQLGDRGTLRTPNGIFAVEDTQAAGGAIIHRGTVSEGELRAGTAIDAAVDGAWRDGATRNHTATHLLHAGLRAVLGAHVRQQGSLVAAERLRFDFTHLDQTPREALIEVEQLVNGKVRANLDVGWRTTSYQQAIAAGALAFFGDKYGNEVRVVEIGGDGVPFSAELCGGTHVHHTGELGFIHVVRESAVAAGTRRIEALAGRSAEEYLLDQVSRLQRIADRLGSTPAEAEARIASLQEELETMRRQVADLERVRTSGQAETLAAAAVEVGDARLVAARAEAGSKDALKDLADRLRQQLAPALIILGAEIEGRPSFLVAATPELVERGVDAVPIVREMAKIASGGGGGRPELAEAGGRDASKIDVAIDQGRAHASAVLTG